MRKVWLILLLLCGSGSLLYGSRFHSVTVYEEKERQISIPIPSLFGFGTPGGQPQGWGQSPFGPPGENEHPPGSAATPDDVNPFEPPPAQGTDDEKTENPGASGAAPEAEEDPFKSTSPPGGPPGMPPFLSQDLTFKKATEKYREAREVPEWVLVREVTFGGVTRLANGELMQTYSGKPPALCPT